MVGNVPEHFSRTVTPAPVLDFTQMTAGEFRLALLADQLRLVGSYYDDAAQLAEADRIKDLLARGFHNATGAGSPVQAINRAIRRAQRLNRPAARVFIRENRAAGLPEAAISGIFGQAGIGEVLIPYSSCEEYIEYPLFNPYDEYSGPDYSQPRYLPGYDECRKTQEYVTLLNDKLTPSSHHLLYEYTGAGEPGSVAAKRVLHRNAVSSLARIAGLDRENLRGWIRNGVIRNNVLNGTAPIQPEDTYKILKEGSQAGVGELVVTLTAFAKIIGAIIGAVTATVGLVNALKNPDKLILQNTAQGIGTPTFGPEKDDFFTAQQPGTPGGLANNKILLPAAAAAAVLLLSK